MVLLGLLVASMAASAETGLLQVQVEEEVVWPVRVGRLTSAFGPRWGRQHQGLDIGAATGTPALAIQAGVVTFAGDKGDYGLVVDIDHGGSRLSRYAHLDALEVEAGDSVDAGAVVGLIGATGNATGPHLHLELRVDGQSVDPLLVLPSGE